MFVYNNAVATRPVKIQHKLLALVVAAAGALLLTTLALDVVICPSTVERTHLLAATGASALVILLAGLLAAWTLGGSLAARVQAIHVATRTITAGHLDRPPIGDGSGDEIGFLARDFDAMKIFLGQLGDALLADAAQEQARLDRLVTQRTAELQEANARLEQEMIERERVEGELRLAQKLEAVGRLASGIAHEINTPVQFVSDTVCFVKDAATDLFALIAKYRALSQSVLDGSPATDAANDAREEEERVDLDYLLERMPGAIERALEGLERVATLVRSMKEFAHPDHTEMAPANLNRAIENTITMTRNEYKYVADIETDFGEMPDVYCRVGEINQAVLNLIVNAAHAIENVVKDTGSRGRIRVSTRQEEDRAVIRIADSGTGIPAEIRDRIFDPFFTTKEVGKGTGQGLAIVRAVVVEKHHGTLRVESEVGKGTTFEVQLPIGGERSSVGTAVGAEAAPGSGDQVGMAAR